MEGLDLHDFRDPAARQYFFQRNDLSVYRPTIMAAAAGRPGLPGNATEVD
jgi:hypothetical protein